MEGQAVLKRWGYVGLGLFLIAFALIEMVTHGRATWFALTFVVLPDMVFLYGARDSGLGHGQISPRAVRPYNLVHSFGGPACLLVAGIWLPTVVFASGLTWAAHIAFDRGLGFAKRSPEGYQKAARPKGAR